MKLVSSIIVFLCFMMLAQSKPEHVQYMLGMSKPSTHYFEVEIMIDNLARSDSHLDFVLPIWRPGRYLVLDFAGGVEDFSAGDGEGKIFAWKKIDKTTWRVELNGSKKTVVRYRVYANEFGLRTRGLNDEHGFVDGTAVFMYMEKFRQLPVTLTVHPYGDWHVTTGLDSLTGTQNAFHAPNYDVFVDCPLEIGEQKDFPFDIDGIPHVLSIAGEGNWNADTMIQDISKIVRTTQSFWGSVPYKRFVFLIHCSPVSGGGTEHLNSVIMGTRPFTFKNHDSYRGFLGLVAHEFFHTWNVKQLRPSGMHPYDYLKENYSEELWIAEGMTSYFDELLLVRSGYQTTLKYLDRLATTVQTDRQRPGNKSQSLSESSFDAWIKFWKGNQQSFNSETDYYGKGAIVSFLLDLEVRHRTSNHASLDSILRVMYHRFPLTGPGYTIKDFQSVTQEIAGDSINQFFNDFIFGVTPLPWEQTFAFAGLELVQKDSVPKPWIGLSLSETNGRTLVSQVSAGSPAYNAGLDFGDELVAMNGYRVRSAEFSDRIKEFAIGDTVKLTLLRNDRLKEIPVQLEAGALLNYRLVKTKNPTPLQISIYENWLGVKWDETAK